MSFGFSCSEIIQAIRYIIGAVSLLRGEAVEGFRKHLEGYLAWADQKQKLQSFIAMDMAGRSELFQRNLAEITPTLDHFLSKIQGLDLYLGAKRRGHTFLAIFKKLTWPLRAKEFQSIQLDLLFQYTRVNTNLGIGNYGRAERLGLIPPDCFVLEDAHFKYWKILLSAVPSWETFHAFLLKRVFPPDKVGHKSIKDWEYLIHIPAKDVTLVPASPGEKPFQQLVAGQRLTMSIILPFSSTWVKQCPGCRRKKRPYTTHNREHVCRHCGLVVRFLGSQENQPDPITKIAMDEIRAQGLKAFTERCRLEQIRCSGETNIGGLPTKAQLESWIQQQVTGNDPQPQPLAVRTGLEAENFRRVAFCKTTWPNLAGNREYVDSLNRCVEVVEGLQRAVSFCEAQYEAPFRLATLIGNAFPPWLRARTRLSQFLREVHDAFRTGDRNATDKCWDITKQSTHEFRPSSMEARVLLWFYFEIQLLEIKVLRSCANLFEQCRIPEVTGPRVSLPVCILSLISAPNLLSQRPRDTVLVGVARFFLSQVSTQILKDIPFLIKNSASTSWDFYIEGDLKGRFNQPHGPSWWESLAQTEKGRRWMESVLRSEGLLLESEETWSAIRSEVNG